MGYDCFNYLPERTNLKEVENLLKLLKFVKLDKDYFYYFDDDDYRTLSGIQLFIKKDENNLFYVHQHTLIHCSVYDLQHLNKTAKEIYKKFKGSFNSDYGTKRYIDAYAEGLNIKGAEAGCYMAYLEFDHNIKRVELYISSVKFERFPPVGTHPVTDSLNPEVVSNNILIPFLIAIIEEFFKTSFKAILKYVDSAKIVSLLKKNKLTDDEIAKIGKQLVTLEDIIVRKKNFQNIDKIIEHFKEIDSKLILSKILKKAYRRKKEAHYRFLLDLINFRNELIHMNQIRANYTKSKLKSDIKYLKFIILTIYKFFQQTYNWKSMDLY